MMIDGYAVWLFVHLGSAINTTLHEDYASIVAMRDFKDHVFRIDQALLVHHAGGVTLQSTRSIVDEQASLCHGNVDAKLKTITEREAADQLKAQNNAFLATVAMTFSSSSSTDARLEPALLKVLGAASLIQNINERPMTQKDHRARETANWSTRIMLLAMSVALPLELFFAYRLGETVLRPVQRSTESARALGEGNLDQVLPVTSHDELGQLADAFNSMVGKLRLYLPENFEQANGSLMRFSVTDHGPGIPVVERERVFEKLHRLPGELKEGAGLGLAICREIVRAHDGEIHGVKAPGGRGSEFFFTLRAMSQTALQLS